MYDYLSQGVDRSGTITTGGTAQTLAPAYLDRKALQIQNISAGDLWVNQMGANAAVATAGSHKVISGDYFNVQTSRAISIIGATTGQAFTAVEA